jgi:hypothetical protein
MKKISRLATPLALVASCTAPLFAFAQGFNTTAINSYTIGSSGIVGIINGLFVPVLMAVAFIVFLYGIYDHFIKGGANEESHTKGREFMIYGIVGFVIIVSIWGIVNLVSGTLNLGGGNNPNPPTINFGGQNNSTNGNLFGNNPLNYTNNLNTGGNTAAQAAYNSVSQQYAACAQTNNPNSPQCQTYNQALQTYNAQYQSSGTTKSPQTVAAAPSTKAPPKTGAAASKPEACSPAAAALALSNCTPALACPPDANGQVYTLNGSDCIPANGGCPPSYIDDPKDPNSCIPASASAACPPDADGTTYIEQNDSCVATNGGCPQSYVTNPKDSNSCIPASASAACPPDANGTTYVEQNDECIESSTSFSANQYGTCENGTECTDSACSNCNQYGTCENGTECTDSACSNCPPTSGLNSSTCDDGSSCISNVCSDGSEC